MTKSKSILDIVNLTAAYGNRRVLDSATCSILKGTIVGVLGEEGSGKSTLVNAITQSIYYTGEIIYKSQILNACKTHQLAHLGFDFLPQGGSVFSQFSVKEHIDFALKLNKEKLKQNTAWKQIENYFPKLLNMKKNLGGTLSGGERIMLSLSCLLVSNCSFILLDEPTSGLSPEVCIAIKPLFKKWRMERKTIVMTEHNYEFAIELCDEILLLKEGRLSLPFSKEITTQSNFVENHLYNFVSN